MALIFADTSALVRAYLADEQGHAELRSLLLESGRRVAASEVARVELAGAVSSAFRARRKVELEAVLRRFDLDVGGAGRVLLLALRPDVVLPRARSIVLEHPVRTLDAIHLAVALEEAPIVAGDEPVLFVTRDARQAAAAAALGLEVA